MINVLSLFDGLSSGQLALRGLGITPTRYYASEIDPFAVEVTQTNFPDTVQLGDVVKLRRYLCATPGNRAKIKSLPYCTAKTRRLIEQVDGILSGGIDLVMGGSPCQGFSFAGKGLNFNDPRSRLFFEFVHILNAIKRVNPNVVFLLENVVMKREHQMVISKYLGVEPICINSALVVAQNRDRLYWTSILARPVNLFGDLQSAIPQPKDRGVLLADILEEDVPEKYYASDKVLARINGYSINPDKAVCLIPGYDYNGAALIMDVCGKPRKNQRKASCLTAGAHSGGNHSDMDLIWQRPRGKNLGGEVGQDGKAPTLSANNWQQNNLLSSGGGDSSPDTGRVLRTARRSEILLFRPTKGQVFAKAAELPRTWFPDRVRHPNLQDAGQRLDNSGN